MPTDISFTPCRYRGRTAEKLSPFTRKVEKFDVPEPMTPAEWRAVARVLNVPDKDFDFVVVKLADGTRTKVGSNGPGRPDGIMVRIDKITPDLLRFLLDLLKAADWRMMNPWDGPMIFASAKLAAENAARVGDSEVVVCRTPEELGAHLVLGSYGDEEPGGTPFDPSRGILFKYGRSWRNRAADIAAVERATSFKLPLDFLDLIGRWCEGGFDGHYRVYSKGRLEVWWTHLLQIKITDDIDERHLHAIELLHAKSALFSDAGGLVCFPFGEACALTWPNRMTKGYLAFDVRKRRRVVFIAEVGGPPIRIAATFRDMMLKSHFVFYG